jgi:hypothetical protein
LKIENEYWLFELVSGLVEADRSYFFLLQFVQFVFVSTDIARRFIESGREFLEMIDLSVWSSLGRRFVQNVSPSELNSRLKFQERKFLPRGKSVDGVIAYLTSKCGGNVHDKGIIVATSSSTYGNRSGCHPKNVTDLQNRTTSSFFWTNNEPNSWLCYGLNNMEIILTHYSILSYPAGSSANHHPKSWCVEVSMTGKDWTEVHQCTDNSDVNGLTLIGTYEVNHSMKCRFVRLRQTGKTHYNTDHLLLCGFEIFGILREP